MSTPSTPIVSSSFGVYSPLNLTGSARKIQDRKALLIREINKWNDCKVKGIEIMKNVNENLPKKNEMTSKERAMMTKSATKLQEILKLMESVVEEISNIYSLMNNSLELNRMASDSVKIRMKRICEKYETLEKSLKKELEVKQSVYSSFCSFPEYSKLRVLGSLWIRDSFVPDGLMEELCKVAS